MGHGAALDRQGGPEGAADGLEARLVDAMLDCISRWGVAKTTADDIARAAGVSRATLYRAFPGGKDVAFEVLLRHETARFFGRVTDRLDEAETLEDLLVVGAIEAAAFLLEHDALGYVLRHEPERVLPALAFHRLDHALALATAFLAPHLGRFVPDARLAADGAEFVVRLLLSYAIDPSPALDLADPANVRRFVRTYVLPVLSTPTDTASKEP
jgi:AcrR family transcriptional regulator